MSGFEQACLKAPRWATHISVNKDTGWCEFYNSTDGKSMPVGSIKRPIHQLSEGFTASLFAGEKWWDLVPISSITLENK